VVHRRRSRVRRRAHGLRPGTLAPHDPRAAVLAKAVVLLEERAEDFKRILALETGHPHHHRHDAVRVRLASLQYFAGAVVGGISCR
jgi:acyl-CoA reductase-like NAD-dependent aldehyde dehydrogenase